MVVRVKVRARGGKVYEPSVLFVWRAVMCVPVCHRQLQATPCV